MFKKFTIIAFTLLCVNAKSQLNVWKTVNKNQFSHSSSRHSLPDKFQALQLNEISFIHFSESFINKDIKQEIMIPFPNGSFKSFVIQQTPVMSNGLSKKYPHFKTWSGYEKENPANTIRIDWTAFGFHAMIFSSNYGTIVIDPWSKNNKEQYISYYKNDFKNNRQYIEDEINISGAMKIDYTNLKEKLAPISCIGTQLRTYRLSVSCTGEYAVAVGATTVEEAMAAIVTTVNRVDGVYEAELAIRMVLIDDEDKLIFIDPVTDPFTANDNGGKLLNENQNVTDAIIGNENYDIGHIFSTGGGGVAALGCVCYNPQKANGVTGLSEPYGDSYDIDYVAHEMGHQFGGDHTFNAASSSCRFNGSRTANVEPGSGSTIMAYAGICGANDLQPHSDPFFSAISRDEIAKYTIKNEGSTCPIVTPTGNLVPIVDAGIDYQIPANTAFTLIGNATDPDGDPINYQWEEVDKGGPWGSWDKPKKNAPLFRAFVPLSIPERTIPQISDILNNTTTVGEFLPNYDRIVTMRLTARDNRTGGSGICSDDKVLTVISTAGPFSITTANTATSWNEGDIVTINWDVANTDQAPINVSAVNIWLSVDGGNTFTIKLADATTNDGTESVTLPLFTSLITNARVKIEAVGNIFFDINNADISIDGTVPVSWLNVSVEKSGTQSAIIKWSTANEFNNNYFEIERSTNNKNYTAVGKQTAGAKPNEVQQYSFNDLRLPMGTFYYRIKQVDKDGKYSYSQTAQITIDANGISWILIPNPATEKAAVLFNKPLSNVRVVVSDANGRTVFSKSEPSIAAGTTIQLPIEKLAKGIYLVKVISNGNTDIQKFVISK